MRVLVKRGGRASLPPAWGRSRELLFRKDFRDKAEVIRAKAKMGHLARRGRRHAITDTSLDTLEGIAHRGRDPRVMGHLSPNRQWDMHEHSLFLLTPAKARGTDISPRVPHKHLLFRRWATLARARV